MLQRGGRLNGGKWDKEVSGVGAQRDSGKKGTMLVEWDGRGADGSTQGGWRETG